MPEDVLPDRLLATVPDRLVDGAVRFGKRGPIRATVVNELMHVRSGKLVAGVAEQLSGRSVGEQAAPVAVEPVDRLGGVVETPMSACDVTQLVTSAQTEALADVAKGVPQ